MQNAKALKPEMCSSYPFAFTGRGDAESRSWDILELGRRAIDNHEFPILKMAQSPRLRVSAAMSHQAGRSTQ